jgi:luciferase family oxidoreductase group 1
MTMASKEAGIGEIYSGSMIPLSLLDLAPIVEGGDAAQALRNSLDLARHAEGWGYRRVWLAEHHNMPGIASSATAVAIAHVAGGTTTIRVGAGGIMLPNHAPLVVAEQFGTLESLHPGRIDLALGRAPGTDPLTARALRYDPRAADDFPEAVLELMAYFRAPEPGQRVRAVPGAGLAVPIWILGSSLYGASLAAALGLPYAFASHFAPGMMMQAIEVYRSRFRPSPALEKPYLMMGVNVFAADTAREARRLMSSRLLSTIALRLGRPGPLPPPVDDLESRLGPMERAIVDELMPGTVAGSPGEVREWLQAFAAKTGADELIVSAQIYEHAARLRSHEIAAQAASEEIAGAAARGRP